MSVTMFSSEELIANTAKDGSIDIAEWPRVLEDLLKRLHDIVHNDFPIPAIPLHVPHEITIDPDVAPSPPAQPAHLSRTSTDGTALSGAVTPAALDNSQSSTKENEGPPHDEGSSSGTTPTLRTPFGYELTHNPAGTETAPPSDGGGAEPDTALLPPDHIAPPAGSLPPELLSLYQTTCRTLEEEFGERPPHTVQRLAEMVVAPRRHYRHLPAYLRALDRIVSVSSPVSDFPLQISNGVTGGAAAGGGGSFITNGDAHMSGAGAGGLSERDGLGSDESLGGALLTPIPWLRSAGNVLAPTPAAEQHAETQDAAVAMELQEDRHRNGAEEPPHAAGDVTDATTTGEPHDHEPAASTTAEPALREQGAITQGELLRQEQRAGIVPIAQHLNLVHHVHRPLNATPGYDSTAEVLKSATTADENPAPPEQQQEKPHARGPEIIDMADTGPQSRPLDGSERGKLDLDRAMGRARSKSPQPESGPAEVGSAAKGADIEPTEALPSSSILAQVGPAEEGDAMEGVETSPVNVETIQGMPGDVADQDVIVKAGESAAGSDGAIAP